MKFIRYFKEGNYLRFTRLYPRFVALVDCSSSPPSIRDIETGSCSPEQIVKNLDELYKFLGSKFYEELIAPEPARKNPFAQREGVKD